MDNLIPKLSINETFRAVLPGLYFVTILAIVGEETRIRYPQSSTAILNGVLFIIVVMVVSSLIYAIDMPKRMSFFKKAAPTTEVAKNYPHISMSKILVSYFKFYDKQSTEMRSRSDLYANLYHSCLNVAFVSGCLAALIGSLWMLEYKNLKEIFIFNTFLGIISFIAAYLTFESKVKKMFMRALTDYLDSQEFQNLTSVLPIIPKSTVPPTP